MCGAFPKFGLPFLGVSIRMTIVFWVYSGSHLIWETSMWVSKHQAPYWESFRTIVDRHSSILGS